MSLTTANGSKLQIAGKFLSNFEIDHLSFSFTFIVADIEERIGILGMDFFEEFNASLKIS